MATSLDNPDFVDVVIHSYRHRFGLMPGDPALVETERRLVAQPTITVPAVTLDGDADGVMAWGCITAQAGQFVSLHEHRVVARGGHNLPQAFAAAVLGAHAGHVGRDRRGEMT